MVYKVYENNGYGITKEVDTIEIEKYDDNGKENRVLKVISEELYRTELYSENNPVKEEFGSFYLKVFNLTKKETYQYIYDMAYEKIIDTNNKLKAEELANDYASKNFENLFLEQNGKDISYFNIKLNKDGNIYLDYM